MSDDRPAPQAVAYWEYIRVQELLGLQGGLENDESALSQDEVVFITVHQVYELWFKLLMRDLRVARGLFAEDPVPDDALAGACRMLTRIRTILDIAAQHCHLVETITPRDYLEFRDKLFPANGGQSVQFREVEILFGLEESERLPYIAGKSYQDVMQEPDGKAGWAARQVRARLDDRPTLKEAVDSWLYRTPIDGSRPGDEGDDEVVDDYIASFLDGHAAAMQGLVKHVQALASTEAEVEKLGERYAGEASRSAAFLRAEEVEDPEERARLRRIRAAMLFIETHRDLPLLAWPREVLEGLVAVEQSFTVFRQRHARMAERVIGKRVGTGGSTGVDYLDAVALKYRVFRDLWGVRTLLVREEHVPNLNNPDFYGFRFPGE
jgi:tryptophan 2,3-dioxygenase